jgi:DNA-binding CsgD family transcriptional regulator
MKPSDQADSLSRYGVSPKESEALSAVVAMVIDNAGRLVYFSPPLQELVGFDCRSWLGKPPPFPWWPAEKSEIERMVEFFGSGSAWRLGVRSLRSQLTRSDGTEVTVVGEYRAVPGRGGKPVLHVFEGWPESAPLDVAEENWAGLLERIGTALYDAERCLERLGVPVAPGLDRPSGQGPRRLRLLSRREWEVASLLLRGKTPQEIAASLSISPHTARNHIGAIFRKLEVHSQVEFMRKLGVGA